MKNKFVYYFVFLSVIISGLIAAKLAFADMPSSASLSYGFNYEVNNCIQGNCNPFNLLKAFVIVVGLYLLITLVIEIIIFLLAGLRKKVWIVVIVNVITVVAYQVTNAFLNDQLSIFSYQPSGWLFAELIIIIIECLFLVKYLRSEMSIRKIIVTTIIANILSIIIGIFIISYLGGLTGHQSYRSSQNAMPNGIPCIPGPGVVC